MTTLILKSLATLSITMLLFTSCTKTEDDNASQNGISDLLHLSFTTPDWNRFIDCSKLNLDPGYMNDSTFYVSATSASTQETFYFSFPSDSSHMVRATNPGKYPIQIFGSHEGYFEFSQKLPITDGSTTKLVSEKGFSETVYNEVSEIKYAGMEGDYALFHIKCRYSMVASVLPDATTKRNINGTFHFVVRTYRK